MLNKSEVLHFENYIDKVNSKSKNALLDMLDMSKKELVLSVHKRKISQLSGKDKRWHTYIPADTPRGIKEIKRNSEKEIIDFLLDFYGLNGITFAELFPEWLKYKETITDSTLTIRRHEQHFKKYFVKEHSKLLNMNIAKIDRLIFQSECNRIVKKYDMASREWSNVKTILNGMFEYAYDKGWVKENVFARVKITVKFRQENKKPSETQVYQSKEYENLINYLDKEFLKDGDLAPMAVKFQLYTGMRVGELVALKWNDVDLDKKTLHIHSMQANRPYRDNTGKWHDSITVAQHTKTNKDRTIQLLPKALDVLYSINPSTNYIFIKEGKRITERQVNYVLEKYADRQGTVTKSSHKLRKTYASRLNAAKVPLDAIQRDLGHADMRSTLGYIYNPCDSEATYELKASAI